MSQNNKRIRPTKDQIEKKMKDEAERIVTWIMKCESEFNGNPLSIVHLSNGYVAEEFELKDFFSDKNSHGVKYDDFYNRSAEDIEQDIRKCYDENVVCTELSVRLLQDGEKVMIGFKRG